MLSRQRIALFIFAALMTMAFLMYSSVPVVKAVDDGGGRFKTVEVVFTRYTWSIVARETGQKICTVSIDHEGFPEGGEIFTTCGNNLAPFLATPNKTAATPSSITPTPGPAEFKELFKAVYWILISQEEIRRMEQVAVPPMSVVLIPGVDQTDSAYVTIIATEPDPDFVITGIYGTLEGRAFACEKSPCLVPLRHDSQIVYWASSSLGDESDHYSANLRVAYYPDGYRVIINQANVPKDFEDVCVADIWGGLTAGSYPEWDSLPPAPESLNTAKTLHYLAGRLIAAGAVDAKECDGGGLQQNGYPNACGLEKARPVMVQWQNQFDPVIWSVSRELGIPAKMIKSVIEQESQFWPGNARAIFLEFGLSQVNELGIDVLFRWDKGLKDLICPGLLFDCNTSYQRLDALSQATLRGGLLSSINAECPSCKYGIDMEKADFSVRTMGYFLRANCEQTGYIMAKQGGAASINDMWKFTMLAYHSGYGCLEKSLANSQNAQMALNWENVSQYLENCGDGKEYVSNLWLRLDQFKQMQPTPAAGAVATFQPQAATFTPQPSQPTRTPTPMPAMIDGTITIQVFVDDNENGRMDDGEGVDGEIVNALFANQTQAEGILVNGWAKIPFFRQVPNSTAEIHLPYLGRSMTVEISPEGQIFITFPIPPPVLPGVLP